MADCCDYVSFVNSVCPSGTPSAPVDPADAPSEGLTQEEVFDTCIIYWVYTSGAWSIDKTFGPFITADTCCSSWCSPSGWCGCLLTILRAHINDLSDDPEYSDTRLMQIFHAAVFSVSLEVSECSLIEVPPFTMCNGQCTIDVDPFNYHAFLNLAILKSACLIDQGSARDSAKRSGISAACGPAKLSVSTGTSAYNTLFKYGPCAAYQELKHDLCYKRPLEAATHCAQVMGAFTSWTIADYADCANTNYLGSCY